MTKYQQLFYDIVHTNDFQVIGDDIDYKVFVDHTNQRVILMFEESDSDVDWFNNLSIKPTALFLEDKVVWTTSGYAKAYTSAHNVPLYSFIKEAETYVGYKKIICGWSFGSAMAKIAARHYFIKTGKQIDELITYGDVKCWLNPKLKPETFSKKTCEFTTKNDFVTWLVPLFHRTNKCQVTDGTKFSIKNLFKTEYYHTHYHTYDYTKYEN